MIHFISISSERYAASSHTAGEEVSKERAMYEPVFVRGVFAALVVFALVSPGPRLAAANEKDFAAGVLATVNGTVVTAEEIDALIEDQLRALRERIEQAWANELDLQINSRLLDAEAKKLGITATDLLRQEVVSEIEEPTEAEADVFFDKNRDRFGGELEDSKEAVLAELRFQRHQKKAGSFAERLRSRAKLAMITEKPTPPATPAERGQVLAVVNDEEITLGDIEDSLKALVFEIEEQIYLRRKAAVDLKVNDLLLQAEAKKRQTSSEAFLEAELGARTKPVTESDARTFFEANEERLGLDWSNEDHRVELLRYLHEREARNAGTAFAEELRAGVSIEMSLEPPASPVYDIATEGEPARGSPTAPVTIVEFVDFECASCAETEAALEKLMTDYGANLRLVARDFPLRQKHPNAYRAALAAEAAREQGKYWEYRRLLFQNQKALGVDNLKAYARDLGLDGARFDAALKQKRFAEPIDKDLQAGLRFGVRSTPTLFVNGRAVREHGYAPLKAAIDEALASVSRAVADAKPHLAATSEPKE